MYIPLLSSLLRLDETDLTIEPESGYPLITGTTIQIHFRRDPFLGLVASFERYEFGGNKKNEPLMEDVEFLQNRLFANLGSSYRGIPALTISFPEKASEDSRPCPHELCGWWRLLDLAKRHNLWLLHFRQTDQIDIFPAKSAKVEGLLGTIIVQGNY